MSAFFKRVLSALFVLIILFGIMYFFSVTGLAYLCWFLTGLAAYEYSQLAFSRLQKSNRMKFLFYLLCVVNYYVGVFHPSMGLTVFALSVLICLAAALLIAPFQKNLEQIKQWSLSSCFGLIYCGVFPSFVGKFLLLEQGLVIFLFVLLAVFSGDIAAYIVGSTLGKTKPMPHISPNKTLEGAIGGLVASVFVSGLMGLYFFKQMPVWQVLFIGFCLGLSAQVGDFFESLLKRINNVKDSGQFMPGHGGLLDRVDGVLFASPVMYFFILIFDGLG